MNLYAIPAIHPNDHGRPREIPAHIKMTTPKLVLHLRSEITPHERRSALTPTAVRDLLKIGYIVNVERSPRRIFHDQEFGAVGATMVPEGSWIDVPRDHVIIGLKDLPESDAPINHSHIQFGHCYKNQEGWDRYLSRFARGGSTLYDVEFLKDVSGHRIAPFGSFAGFAGAIVALMAWSHKILHPSEPVPAVPEYSCTKDVIETARVSLGIAVAANGNQYPRILLMGARERSGNGAIHACFLAGIPSPRFLKCDIAVTAAGGPFPEIAASDIFINCVYLEKRVPPFITLESLATPVRKLRIICDVSCDYNSPHNPIPIYHHRSTFTRPTIPINVGSGPSLDVISIDNLASLLARDASDSFCVRILPTLKTLHQRHEKGFWYRAEGVFLNKVRRLPADMKRS